MRLSMVALGLAGVLAFVAIAASPPAVNDIQVASMVATKAAVAAASFGTILGMRASFGDTVEWLVAATHRHQERGAPLGPVDLHHHQGDSAVLVSVDDVYDRSRKALQEGTFL